MYSQEEQLARFNTKGWCRFPNDPILLDWLQATLPAARAAISAPENREWLRYQRTWFAGVNVLPNDAHGTVLDGLPLAGRAVDFIASKLGLSDVVWDRAQISVCYPGYPKKMDGESDAVFKFRKNRDAAHVDGLLKEGPDRRRYLREHHAFILGIPMTEFSTDASPFTVWEGSHHQVGAAFREFFGNAPPDEWAEMDLTDTYQTVRRNAFDTCQRIEVHAKPGECFLVHRHAVHGMAAWGENATATSDGRAIIYFRPELNAKEDWLHND